MNMSADITRELNCIARELQSIVADSNAWPPTDQSGCCCSCGAWTPARHTEAHDHADDCPAEKEYRERRNTRQRCQTLVGNIYSRVRELSAAPTPAPAPAFTGLLRQNHSCTIQAGKPLCRFSEAQDGEWVHITDLRRWIGGRPAPAPVTVSDDALLAAIHAHNGPNTKKMGLWYYCADFVARMRAALEAYESARGAGDGWVACSERMPEKDTTALIWVPRCYGLEHADWNGKTWNTYRGASKFGTAEVTHWRPLPPPPTDKAREE